MGYVGALQEGYNANVLLTKRVQEIDLGLRCSHKEHTAKQDKTTPNIYPHSEIPYITHTLSEYMEVSIYAPHVEALPRRS